MATLWIRYNESGQPVRISIGDMVDVMNMVDYLDARTRALKDVDATEISVHSNDFLKKYGVEEKLSTIPPNTSKTPLIVKRRLGAALEAKNIEVGKGEAPFDDINIKSPHLPRHDLVSKLAEELKVSRIVVISSPPATGKTSLHRLFRNAYEDCEGGTVPVIRISCRGAVPLEELLLRYAMFDIRSGHLNYPTSRNVVVFLDDAQSKYDKKEDLENWSMLAKDKETFSPHIRFVIAATHSVDNFQISPTVLKNFTKIHCDDFLLSEEESMDYLQLGSNIGLPQHMRLAGLMDRLVAICGGLVGALRMSIRALRNHFQEKTAVNEDELIRFLFTSKFCYSMERCYGARTIKHSQPMVCFLQTCFGEPTLCPQFDDDRDVVQYENLRKCGILLEEDVDGVGSVTRFTSTLSKRYFIQRIFPHRGLKNPKNLEALIKHAIYCMSPNALLQACGPPEDRRKLPKEAVFQHLFMKGLSSGTLSGTHICPELSQVFGTGATISREIDFFVNGLLSWGIELVIDGDNITGHMNRFRGNGPYVPLNCGENWCVVDFRVSKDAQITNVRKEKHRGSVFYEEGGDFSYCNVAIGETVQRSWECNLY